MAYIGRIGQMIKLYPISTEEVSYSDASSFKQTMGGRVVEQRGPRPRRTWEIGFQSLFSQDVGALDALRMGAYGEPPWAWLPPDALSVNALPLGTSLLEPGNYNQFPTSAGSVFVPAEGFRVPSTIMVPAGSSTQLADPDGAGYKGVPVMFGETVTGSFYAFGIGRLTLRFRDSAGAQVSIAFVDFNQPFGRVSLSSPVPAGAHDVVLLVSALTTTVRVGGPTVTWTDSVQPWGLGRGSNSVSISSSSESLQKAIRGRSDHNRSEYSVTVREVG